MRGHGGFERIAKRAPSLMACSESATDREGRAPRWLDQTGLARRDMRDPMKSDFVASEEFSRLLRGRPRMKLYLRYFREMSDTLRQWAFEDLTASIAD